MADRYQSLSHSRWNGKVVFVPKRRKKTSYGDMRKALGLIFHGLARQKEGRIIEGHLMPDHVHMCIEIPPKPAVASMIGFLKRCERLEAVQRGRPDGQGILVERGPRSATERALRGNSPPTGTPPLGRSDHGGNQITLTRRKTRTPS